MSGTMSKWMMAAACAAGLMMGAAGCKSDAPPIGGLYDVPGPYPNISLSNPSLQEAVKFQTPIVTRTENGNMQVTVPLRANSNQTLHVEYRVLWFNGSGHQLRPEMQWAPLRLEPRQPQQVTVNSSSAEATDYNLQMRWGQP